MNRLLYLFFLSFFLPFNVYSDVSYSVERNGVIRYSSTISFALLSSVGLPRYKYEVADRFCPTPMVAVVVPSSMAVGSATSFSCKTPPESGLNNSTGNLGTARRLVDCPGAEIINEYTGLCEASEPECPPDLQKVLQQSVSKTSSTGVLTIYIGGGAPSSLCLDKCNYVFDPTSKVDTCYLDSSFGSTFTSCDYNMKSDGTSCPTSDTEVSPAEKNRPQTDKTSSNSVEKSPPVQIVNPDGTVTTTEEETVVDVQNDGTEVSTDEVDIKVDHGGKIIKTEKTTTVTTPKPDGTTEEVTTIDTLYEREERTEVKVTRDDGTVVITVIEPLDDGSVITITKTIKPDGTVDITSTIDSTGTGEDGGTGTGFQEDGESLDLSKIEDNTLRTANNTDDIKKSTEGLCLDGECTVDIRDDDAPGQLQDGKDSLKSQKEEESSLAIGIIGGHLDPLISAPFRAVSAWFPSIPISSCSGGINTTIFGHAFVLNPCDKLQILRDVLAWVFYILTAISIFYITFGAYKNGS
jgi:hypothetical protein